MEGYILLQKQSSNDMQLFRNMKRYIRKYLILDPKDSSLVIYSKKPIDVPDTALSSEDLENEAEVECIIDFHHISDVEWKKDGKKGKRFDVTFQEFNKKHTSKYRFLAKSVSEAKLWTSTISRKVTTSNLRRKTLRAPSTLTALRRTSTSPRLQARGSHGDIGQARHRPGRSADMGQGSYLQSPLVDDGQRRKSDRGQFAFQVVHSKTMDKDMLDDMSLAMSPKPKKDKKDSLSVPGLGSKSLGGARKSIQLIITPFKELVWERINLFGIQYGGSTFQPWRVVPLKEKVVQVMEKAGTGGGKVEDSDFEYDSDKLDDELGMYFSDSENDIGPDVEIDILMPAQRAKKLEERQSEDDWIRSGKVLKNIASTNQELKEALEQADLSKICSKMLKAVKRTTTKYNFRTFDNILQGSRILEWISKTSIKGIKIESRQDCIEVITNFLRQGLIVSFPQSYHGANSLDQTMSTHVKEFSPDGLYTLPLSDRDAKTTAVLKSRNFENFDFWASEIQMKCYKTERVTRGLKTYRNCYKGSDLMEWAITNPLCFNQVEGVLFFTHLLQKGAMVDLANPHTKQFKTSGVYHLTGSRTLSSFFEDDDFEDMAGGVEPEPDPIAYEKLATHVVRSDFIEWFCRLTDDISIYKVLLSECVRHGQVKDDMIQEDPHEPKGMTKRKHEHRNVLYQMLMPYSVTTIDKAVNTLQADDEEAHGLAFDAVWEIVKKRHLAAHVCSDTLSCSICQSVDRWIYQFGRTYLSDSMAKNEQVVHSILHAMISEMWMPMKPESMNQDVVRPGLWRFLFATIHDAAPHVMYQGLKEAYSLILSNPNNVLGIQRQEGWEVWLVQFVFLKDDAYNESIVAAEHFLSQCLTQLFTISAEFGSVVRHVLKTLEYYHSHARNSIGVTFSVLSMLLKNLSQSNHIFPHSISMQELTYANLIQLLETCLAFVFQRAQWGSNMDAVDYGLHASTDGEYMVQHSRSIIQMLNKLLRAGHIQSNTEDYKSSDSAEKQYLKEIAPHVRYIKNAEKVFAYLVYKNAPIRDVDFYAVVSKQIFTKEESKFDKWFESSLPQVYDQFAQKYGIM